MPPSRIILTKFKDSVPFKWPNLEFILLIDSVPNVPKVTEPYEPHVPSGPQERVPPIVSEWFLRL